MTNYKKEKLILLVVGFPRKRKLKLLNDMDYENKYKEALDRAKKAYKKCATYGEMNVLESLFPELKEDEDERIRKDLIYWFKTHIWEERMPIGLNFSNEKVIAWLEKQGEQKETPCDKCRKEQPSHSCQDISELGRCALEHQSGQTSAWSEDEEAILKAIMQDIRERHPDAMWNIDTSKTAAVSTEFIIKFLKSLKPQSQWKPSEEQINALEHFVRSIGESGYASPYDNNTKLIYSLLNDLKKL